MTRPWKYRESGMQYLHKLGTCTFYQDIFYVFHSDWTIWHSPVMNVNSFSTFSTTLLSLSFPSQKFVLRLLGFVYNPNSLYSSFTFYIYLKSFDNWNRLISKGSWQYKMHMTELMLHTFTTWALSKPLELLTDHWLQFTDINNGQDLGNCQTSLLPFNVPMLSKAFHPQGCPLKLNSSKLRLDPMSNLRPHDY